MSVQLFMFKKRDIKRMIESVREDDTLYTPENRQSTTNVLRTESGLRRLTSP